MGSYLFVVAEASCFEFFGVFPVFSMAKNEMAFVKLRRWKKRERRIFSQLL